MDISKYDILVMPDEVLIPEKFKPKLQKFLNSRKGIISSAFSGLTEEKKEFALKDWRIDFKGEEEYNVYFFKVLKEINQVPDSPISVYEPGIKIIPKKGTKILAKVCKPYFNRHWDGLHGYVYIPPDRDTDRPALVQSGNIFHFSFPIFRSYFKHAFLPYKNLARNCIEQVLPSPLLKTKNIPSFARVTLTQKDNLTMIHVLSYVPELRGEFQAIEDAIVLKDVEISLRMNVEHPTRVYLAPSKQNLSFDIKDRYLNISIPEITGYQMIVVVFG